MAKINLYNSSSKQKELFVSQEENKVKIYVCGPTVYELDLLLYLIYYIEF